MSLVSSILLATGDDAKEYPMSAVTIHRKGRLDRR